MQSKSKQTIINSTGVPIKPIIRNIFYALVLIISFSFFAQKIIFVNADLGRHIKNGEVFVKSGKVISTNFYSYTEPEFKTINHHWGSGVIFYFIHQWFDFKGLSVIYCLLSALTVFFFYKLTEMKSNSYLAFLAFMLCIPLIANRTEIRPEAFSLLLIAVYVYLLERFISDKINFKQLIIMLPLLQVLWVNLHIFFIMGIMIIAVYAFYHFLFFNKAISKKLLILFLVSMAVCVLNPMGVEGMLTPLTIFKNYAYMIAENQSVFFMQNRTGNTAYLHYEIISFVAFLLLLFHFKKNKFSLKSITPIHLLTLLFIVLGYRAIRMIPAAALFVMYFVAQIFWTSITLYSLKLKQNINRFSIAIASILVFITIGKAEGYYSMIRINNGFGLYDKINNSALFFKSIGVKGPIFNNYDIGGYLIYHLYPQEKLFVDNRPEAYSTHFFEKEYNPMLEKENVWQALNAKYNFNCIYFFRLDETPHAQPFLIRRINDRTNWAAVYVDAATIILLKRNEQNSSIIKQFELPPETFKVTSN